jgi:hypothetical protein
VTRSNSIPADRNYSFSSPTTRILLTVDHDRANERHRPTKGGVKVRAAIEVRLSGPAEQRLYAPDSKGIETPVWTMDTVGKRLVGERERQQM